VRAVVIREFGPPEVLEPAEVEDVRAGPDDVVIDVDFALARDLGADLTVDYRSDGWERQVRDATGQVDVVFDGVGGDIGLAAFGLLGAGGRFCPFGMASGSFAPVTPEQAAAWRVTVRTGAGGRPEELAALARTALAEAAAGRLRPVIGQEFELAQAAAAHAAIEARETIGKTLLTVPR
jgi:NADPH:quinone reductase